MSLEEVGDVLAEVVRDGLEVPCVKVLHLGVVVLPLGPVVRYFCARAGSAAGVVGVEVVDKVGVVCLNILAGIVWEDAEEDLQKVRGVECAKDRRAVVVASNVRPGGNLRVQSRGVLEEDSASDGESDVAEDSGEALESGVELVEDAGAEGGSFEEGDGVQVDELIERVLVAVAEETSAEVVDQFGGSPSGVGLEEGEESALVLLITDDHGHSGVLLCQEEILSALREDLAVRTGKVGKVESAVRENTRNRVGGALELVVRKVAETLESVGLTTASCGVDNPVVDGLGLRTVDGFGGDDRARVHDGTTEERLALVNVVAVVQAHLVPDRDGASRLSPDSDLGGITTERSNVVGDPLETHTLVEMSQVGSATGKDLLATQPTVGTNTIVDGYEDVRLTIPGCSRNEAGSVVRGGPSKLSSENGNVTGLPQSHRQTSSREREGCLRPLCPWDGIRQSSGSFQRPSRPAAQGGCWSKC